jgi:hypothetical protein
MNQRLHRVAGMSLLVVIITACSFKTVYNQLDYLIPEYVEGMVTLDDVLEDKVEQRSEALLNWHRNTQLKPYADWLRAIQRDAGENLTEQTVKTRITEAELFWQSLAARINDEMSLLLPMLNIEQQAELFINIEDRNETFREEFVDLGDDQRTEDYEERITDTYENWIGELTDEQALAVKQASSELVSTADLRLQRRLEWQRGIREILAEQGSNENKTLRLRTFLAGFEGIDNDEMSQKSAYNREVVSSLTVRISRSMTDQQKAHFINKTDEYIRIFTELAENR